MLHLQAGSFLNVTLDGFFYTIFLSLYAAAFRVTALFNNKARLGIAGRKNVFEKISSYSNKASQQLIWMHCASLGEFEQGRPVLEALNQQYPHARIALSFFSSSGYEAMKNYGGADIIFYLPLDSASSAKKLTDILKPSLVLWIKYEFWYYYLRELKRRNIPVLLVSGIFRESHPFFRWYGGMWRKMLQCFTHFFVQNEASRNMLATKNIQENITVSGDTRFDRVIQVAQKFEPIPHVERFCGDNKVVVAGSTWEEDETELIHYVRANPQIRFIIAPHEISAENLKDVKKGFTNAVFYSELVNQQQASAGSQPHKTPNVLIIDNVGMLSRLYYYADISYVGGGFGADGVHNVLEAAVYGHPVIYGPEFEKYSEAIGLFACSGGISVGNALELENTFDKLWTDEALRVEKGEAAKNYVYAHAGATKEIVRFIQANRLLIN